MADDERFRRDGNDLVSLVDLAATAAMLGTTISVETLDGPEQVEVAPGTQPGSEKVLRGHGLPRLGGGRRGDQRLLFHVIVPSNLTDEQRRITAQLEQTIGPENLEPEDGGGIFSRVRRAFG